MAVCMAPRTRGSALRFCSTSTCFRLRLGCHKSSQAAPPSVGMPRPVRKSLINGGYQQVGNPSVAVATECRNSEQGDGALPVSQKSLLESNGRRAFLGTNWGFTQCRRSISEKMQAQAKIGSGPEQQGIYQEPLG